MFYYVKCIVWFCYRRCKYVPIYIYFDNVYENSWFEDNIVKDIIFDTDKSKIDGLCVLSPVLGSISVEKLSGGCKVLILMYKLDDFVVNLTWLSENCEDWLIKISNLKNIKVVMTGYDLHFIGKELNFRCLNDGELIRTGGAWCRKCVQYIR